MKLRLILLVLSLLAFFSASAGGYFYYSALKESAFKEAERQAVTRVEMIKRTLSSLLAENRRPVATLAGMSPARAVLEQPLKAGRLAEANTLLDHFCRTLKADVCYLMDLDGNTLASSNRHEADSFVGRNFAFRPYFQEAVKGQPAFYMALGAASGKRGGYNSHPVYGGDGRPTGVAVIKSSIELIEKKLGLAEDETVLVVDPNGVVFIANHRNLLYQVLWRLPAAELARIADSRQFGREPLAWSGFQRKNEKSVIDRAGREYLLHQTGLDGSAGWRIVHLRGLRNISKAVSEPLLRITRPIILTLCVLVGASVLLLYQKARGEILQRKAVQEALRESDSRYRSLYHNTPAMLHSIDLDGCLVSVSDHWCEVLGYGREEVIGRRLTDFFTDASRQYAEQEVFPDFFAKGFCKDIPYQFVKKDGAKVDILLSAIADRDERGNIVRSLAVSIDVTERNRAVVALRQAKEELSLYSKDLEKQVSKRTREITNILKYTPDVVYVKDREGRYLLVNSRFEELFGVRNEEIRGLTDYEIASKEVADQFRCHDLQVMEEGRPCQVEEIVPHQEGLHTYLAVKFPVYDEDGAPCGVCGISTDITAVKKAQDQLRRLSGSIMASQEKERSAIARELHDELGQLLTALRLDSVWILERLKKIDPRAAERALAMRDLIDKTIEDIRGIAIRLRPGVLDDLGLVDALEWFAADFERRSGITCVFKSHGVPEIKDTVATAAYRISQEALTNVARHAAASRVDITLEVVAGELLLTVADDGCGLAQDKVPEAEGVGLAGMRERAALAGGTLTVKSGPGRGVRVGFRVMIDSQAGRGTDDQGIAG